VDTTQENEEKLKRFMLPRLFGMVAVVDRPKDSETFPMCSGVVMELRGSFVLVTVAHYLRDLAKWEKERRLLEVDLIIHNDCGCPMAKVDLNQGPQQKGPQQNVWVNSGSVVLLTCVFEAWQGK